MECPEGGFVVSELVHQRSHQDGCIEQRTHSVCVVADPGVARIAFGADEFSDFQRGAYGAVVHENTLLANKGRFGDRPAQGDAVSDGLELQFTPGHQVELLP